MSDEGDQGMHGAAGARTDDTAQREGGVARLIAVEDDAVARALALLGERWTFLILRQAFFGVRRFGELQRNLGISRTVLTQRLGYLVDAGLLERRRYRVEPDWYEYRLTERGEALYPIILAVTRWADEHLSGGDGPTLVLRHERCGHDVAPLRITCGHCGEEVAMRDIRPEPGPGARTALSGRRAAERALSQRDLARRRSRASVATATSSVTRRV